jgi:hypothetical protein
MDQQTGTELFAAAQAAQQAFKDWLAASFPIGAKVEFPFYGTPKEGEVAGYGYDRANDPYIYILHAKGSLRINPITNSVKILASITPQD